jgi:valyl-tRNA synthetase
MLPARMEDGNAPHELVGRMSRLRFDGEKGEPIASIGPVEVMSSDEVDAEQVSLRTQERRQSLRAEVERAERKLANDGFVANAPTELVDAEREKLAAYRAELEDLG